MKQIVIEIRPKKNLADNFFFFFKIAMKMDTGVCGEEERQRARGGCEWKMTVNG